MSVILLKLKNFHRRFDNNSIRLYVWFVMIIRDKKKNCIDRYFFRNNDNYDYFDISTRIVYLNVICFNLINSNERQCYCYFCCSELFRYRVIIGRVPLRSVLLCSFCKWVFNSKELRPQSFFSRLVDDNNRRQSDAPASEFGIPNRDVPGDEQWELILFPFRGWCLKMIGLELPVFFSQKNT